MKTGPRLLKNFLSLSAADIVVRLLSTVVTVYIARYLGVGAFGQLAFASAYTSYLTLLSLFGLPTLGIREIAKDKSQTSAYAANILVLRIALSIILIILFGVLLVFLPLDGNLKLLVFLFSLSAIPGALDLSYVFQAHERMEFAALARIATQVVAVALSFILIYATRNILVLPIQQFITSLLGAFIILRLLKKHLAFTLAKVNVQAIKRLVKQAVPFVVSALAIQLYYNSDAILLQFMKGSEVVGYYTAGYKLVLIITALASFFQSAIYPTIANFLKNNREKAVALIRDTSKWLIFISLPAAVGGTVLAPKIIEFVYGPDYGLSVLPLQILIWSIFTVYANVSFAVTLLAGDREKQYTKSAVVGSLLSLVFNLLLIPKFSLVGAAISRMLAEFYVFVSLYYYAGQMLNVGILKNLGQSFFASIVMGVVLLLLDLNLVFSVILGLALYAVILITFKFVGRSDLDFALSMLGKGKE